MFGRLGEYPIKKRFLNQDSESQTIDKQIDNSFKLETLVHPTGKTGQHEPQTKINAVCNQQIMSMEHARRTPTRN